MEIRLINGKSQTDSAVRLMRETFMHSVAPLYAPRGVDNFPAFIEDRMLVQSLELFGAFENEALVGAECRSGLYPSGLCGCCGGTECGWYAFHTDAFYTRRKCVGVFHAYACCFFAFVCLGNGIGN